MKAENKKVSHNVYYDKDNYRIRLYRNDHKIFEKQMKIQKIHHMNFEKVIIFILQEFQNNLANKERLKDSQATIIDFANAINKMFFFQDQMEENND